MKPVQFEPEAQAEFLEAVSWYMERSQTAARRLIKAVDDVAGELPRWPKRFAKLDQPRREPPVRRARVKRFPYALVFIEQQEDIRVLAVAHQRRRPLYWVSRLPL